MAPRRHGDTEKRREHKISVSLIRRLCALACWAATVGITATLAFSYALPQRLADRSPIYVRLVTAAYFGRTFTFHAGLLLTAIAILALILRCRRLTRITAIIATVTLWPTLRACLPRHVPPPASQPLRVMSMNTKYTNRDAIDIVAQVRRFNPDVLAVQEFASPVRETLDNAFGDDYPFRCMRLNGDIALALYSRVPFDAAPVVSTGSHRRQIRAVLRIGGKPVALYVLHPLSPRSRSRIVWNRLSIVDVVDQLQREPLPVILAGDFNFTAETPNARALTSTGLTDAFDYAGWGRGSTWPVRPTWTRWLPGVRIDHVYLSPGLTCTHYSAGGFMGSDHLPIVADVAVARAPGT